MRRFAFLFILIVLVTALAIPSIASAQDATPAPVATATLTAPVDVAPQPAVPVYLVNDEPKVLGDTIPANTFVVIVIVGGGMFLAVVGGYAYSQHTTVKALYQGAPAYVRQAGQTGLEILRNEAEKTETPLDDMALDKVIDDLGYDKSELSDGRIVLTPRPPTPATP